MIHKNGKHSSERRKHRRFAVVEDLIEPIVLKYRADGEMKETLPDYLKTQPAILINLSAGGMSLITFLAPPHARRFKMTLTIPGIQRLPVEGRVVRVDKKGETFNVGISFTQISARHQKAITRMAVDDADCETRVGLGLPEACVPNCSFHHLCTKSQKAPHWPPRA